MVDYASILLQSLFFTTGNIERIILKGSMLITFALLNYILIDNQQKYKLSSLKELRFSHGTDYLNELTKKTNQE